MSSDVTNFSEIVKLMMKLNCANVYSLVACMNITVLVTFSTFSSICKLKTTTTTQCKLQNVLMCMCAH